MKKTLSDSPETPLGFSVMAITSSTEVTPLGTSTASSAFLLPYTEGQVEALLVTPKAPKGKREGVYFGNLKSDRQRASGHREENKTSPRAEPDPLQEATDPP